MHNDLTLSANCEVLNILDFFLSHFVSLIRLNKLCCRYVDIKQCQVSTYSPFHRYKHISRLTSSY